MYGPVHLCISCLAEDFHVPKRSIQFYFSNVSRDESCRTKMNGEKSETLKHARLNFNGVFMVADIDSNDLAMQFAELLSGNGK